MRDGLCDRLTPWPELRELDVPAEYLVQANEQRAGTHTHIVTNTGLDAILQREYCRSGLCLKVFRPQFVSLRSPEWEGVHIAECCRVQNIFAWEGLAPRIYDLVLVDGMVAQVTDYLEPEPGQINREAYDRVIQTYDIDCFGRPHHYKSPLHNWVGDKLVDFGGLKFKDDLTGYEQRLWEQSIHNKIEGRSYQSLWGEDAMRDTEHRLSVMRFDEIDFTGKTVLDVGCNVGVFAREALERGAVRAVGVDHEKAHVAYQLSNWLGYWQADFLPLSLPDQWDVVRTQTQLDRFDIVLFLAVILHVEGLDPRVRCDLLLFEGHRKPRECYQPKLEAAFDQVDFLGYTTDMGRRPVFRCEGQLD